ncbi:hypothetical protein [Sphingobium sp. HWE2-09]|uniref:hypothetical protein n=1 Tax=Sphingobium sp. HWE2-09 TaxID=3108390 RepID=UPI002DCA34B5|nr:hypothetical protein [Sphingobium sp. HWE2-09]
MTQTTQPIVIDYSRNFLPGSPLAVTVILSDQTWDLLTKHIDDVCHFGAPGLMPLNLRIERYIEIEAAVRCYTTEDALDEANDLTGEIPF